MIRVGNDIELEIHIREKGVAVPLINGSVSIVFKTDKRKFIKEATIIDLDQGICQVNLTGEDLMSDGIYQVQGIVKFTDKEFASDIGKFNVGARL